MIQSSGKAPVRSTKRQKIDTSGEEEEEMTEEPDETPLTSPMAASSRKSVETARQTLVNAEASDLHAKVCVSRWPIASV